MAKSVSIGKQKQNRARTKLKVKMIAAVSPTCRNFCSCTRLLCYPAARVSDVNAVSKFLSSTCTCTPVSATLYFREDHCRGAPISVMGMYNASLETEASGYSAGLHCLFVLDVTSVGLPERTSVNITLKRVNLPRAAGGSCSDFVRVYKGTHVDETKAVFPPLCGDSLPEVPIHLILTDTVLVEFKSTTGGGQGQGVWIYYKRIRSDVARVILDERLYPSENSFHQVSELLSGSEKTSSSWTCVVFCTCLVLIGV